MMVNIVVFTVFIMCNLYFVTAQDDPGDPDNRPKIGDVANSNPFDAAVNHDANDDIGQSPLNPNGTAAGNVNSSATMFLSTPSTFAPAAISPNTTIGQSVSTQISPASTVKVRLTILIPYIIPFILRDIVK